MENNAKLCSQMGYGVVTAYYYGLLCIFNIIWAATWQNQQSEFAPSEDSDQPEHPPSLISLRCPHEETLGP